MATPLFSLSLCGDARERDGGKWKKKKGRRVVNDTLPKKGTEIDVRAHILLY